MSRDFTPESRWQRDEWRREREMRRGNSGGCAKPFLGLIVAALVIGVLVLKYIAGTHDMSISHRDLTLKLGERIEVPSGDVIKDKPTAGSTTFTVTKAGFELSDSTPVLYTSGVGKDGDPCNNVNAGPGKGTITLPWGDINSRGQGVCIRSGTKTHPIDTRVHFKDVESVGPTSKVTLTSWNGSQYPQ